MTELSRRVIEVVLMSLGEDFAKKFYDSESGNCHGYLRIINYTAPKSTVTPLEKEEEEVEGLGMHTDMSCVTIVYQDQMGGLQVRSKQGKWMDINPCDQTLVVNIGDLMQAWSNGKLRSSEHRVVLRPHVSSRFSLAFFWCFEDRKAIHAPDEVVGEGGVRAYELFVCEDYLKFREIGSEEVREFEKVGFTVKDFAGITSTTTTRAL